MLPFNPQQFYDQYATDGTRTASNYENPNFVLHNSKGEFEEEQVGWIRGHTAGVDRFGRSVSLYFHRDEELDKLPELQCAKKSYGDDQARDRLEKRKAVTTRTVSDLLRISEEHVRETTSTIHCCEVELLQAVMAGGNFEVIKGKVEQLMDTVSNALSHRDLNWQENVKSFLKKEKATIKQQCVEYLSVSDNKLPENVLESLDVLEGAIDFCLANGSKGFNLNKKDWDAYEEITRQFPGVLEGLDGFQFARTHRLIWGLEDDLCSGDPEKSKAAIDRFSNRLNKVRGIKVEPQKGGEYPFGATARQIAVFEAMMNAFPNRVKKDHLKLMMGKWLTDEYIVDVEGKNHLQQKRNLFISRLDLELDKIKRNPPAGEVPTKPSTRPSTRPSTNPVVQQQAVHAPLQPPETDIPGHWKEAFQAFINSDINGNLFSMADIGLARQKGLLNETSTVAITFGEGDSRRTEFEKMRRGLLGQNVKQRAKPAGAAVAALQPAGKPFEPPMPPARPVAQPKAVTPPPIRPVVDVPQHLVQAFQKFVDSDQNLSEFTMDDIQVAYQEKVLDENAQVNIDFVNAEAACKQMEEGLLKFFPEKAAKKLIYPFGATRKQVTAFEKLRAEHPDLHISRDELKDIRELLTDDFIFDIDVFATLEGGVIEQVKSGIKGKINQVRNRATERRKDEEALAFMQAHGGTQDPNNPGLHHQRAYDLAKMQYSELRSNKEDPQKVKEKEYLRLALAQKVLPDGLIEDCFHLEKRTRNEALTRLKKNVLRAVNGSQPKEEVVYIPELSRQEASRQLTHERKEVIKRELLEKKLINSDFEFEYLIAGVHPEKILSRRRPTFVEQVEGFRILQDPEAAKAKYQGHGQAALDYEYGRMESVAKLRKTVRPADFAVMVNNSLLTTFQLQKLRGADPVITAECMIGRIVRMEPEFLIGFGFGNFSNCCNFNTAIQVMVRSVPPMQVQEMRRTDYGDDALNQLRDSLCDILEKGHAILYSGAPPKILAEEQVKLFEALKYCAIGKKLHTVGNKVFCVPSIDEMIQEDTSQIVIEIMKPLGLKASPALGFNRVFVQSAQCRGVPVHRVAHEDDFDIDLSTFGDFLPEDKCQRNTVTLQDWSNTFFYGFIPKDLEGNKKWKRGELPVELQSSAPAEQQLATTATQYLKVDTRQWRNCQMTLGVTAVERMTHFARQAALNPASQKIRVPVIDENGQFRTAVLKLKAMGLQRSQGGAGGGHYLLASVGENYGDWTIQDDDRSMPYDDWRDTLEHGVGADPVNRWMDFQALLNVGKYTPATCIFDVVGYE